MEQRIKDIESLIETIVKQYIDQNKVIIETNHDLLKEINELRNTISRQDEENKNFKNHCTNQMHNFNMQLNLMNALFQTTLQNLTQPQPIPPTPQCQPNIFPQPPSNVFHPQFLNQPPPILKNPGTSRSENLTVKNDELTKFQEYKEDGDEEYDDEYDYLEDENELTINNLKEINLLNKPNINTNLNKKDTESFETSNKKQNIGKKDEKNLQSTIDKNPIKQAQDIKVTSNLNNSKGFQFTDTTNKLSETLNQSSASNFSFSSIVQQKPIVKNEPSKNPTKEEQSARTIPFVFGSTKTDKIDQKPLNIPTATKFSFGNTNKQTSETLNSITKVDSNSKKSIETKNSFSTINTQNINNDKIKSDSSNLSLSFQNKVETKTTKTEADNLKVQSAQNEKLANTVSSVNNNKLFNFLPQVNETLNKDTENIFLKKYDFKPSVTESSVNAKQLEQEEEELENPEEYEPKIDFKPLVKLEEVETKTGEENEDVIFKEKCKLYRFDSTTKEWKEKGIGEIKILKQKNIHSYRILMRRDQVFKICLNHKISTNIKFEVANEKSIRWTANDYSDGKVILETLLAKFKSESEAKNYKNELDKIQSLDLKPQVIKNESDPKKPDQDLKPLSEMFKNDNKWKCDGCLVFNEDKVDECSCCKKQKPGISKSNNNELPAQNDRKTVENKNEFVFGSNNNNPPVSSSSSSLFSFGSMNNSQIGSVYNKALPAQNDQKIVEIKNQFVFGSNTNNPPVSNSFGSLFSFGSSNNSQIVSDSSKIVNSSLVTDTKKLVNQETTIQTPLNQTNNISTSVDTDNTYSLFNFGNLNQQANSTPLNFFNPPVQNQNKNNKPELETCLVKQVLKNSPTSESGYLGSENSGIAISAVSNSIFQFGSNSLSGAFNEENKVSKVLLSPVSNTDKSNIDFNSNKSDLLVCSMFPEVFENSVDNPIIEMKVNKVENKDFFKTDNIPETKYNSSPFHMDSKNDDCKIVYVLEANEEEKQKAKVYNLPENFYLYEKKKDCKGCAGCEKNE